MGKALPGSASFTQLRTQAEEFLNQNPETLKEMPSESIHRLIHELNVHQIELEMQNEELRKVQMELEESRSAYVDLYDFAPVGYFTIDQKGLILGANLTGANLLRQERRQLLKSHFSKFVASDSQDDLYLHYKQILQTKTRQTLELKLTRQDGSAFHGQLESIAAKNDQGDLNLIRTSLIDITLRKQVEEELHIHQKQLRSLALDLCLTEERVRRQIAYDLHESVLQDLCFVKMHLDRLSAEGHVTDLPCQLEQPNLILARAIQQSRSLTFQLCPHSLYDVGLETSLKTMLREVQEQHRLECSFTSMGIDQFCLSDDTAIILYRSACELVNNVVKHAQASHVKMQLRGDATTLFITVQDNGTGFDMTQTTQTATDGGLGLFSIQERLGHIGGKLSLDSTAGQGTCVTLGIPLTLTANHTATGAVT